MSLQVQKILRMTIVGVYAGLIFALKEALMLLPNIEVVTFLIAFAALVFPLTMALPIPLIFVVCEIILRGLASWNILYLIAWPLLVILIHCLRHLIKKWWWTFIVLNSLWGFSFGTLDSLINLVMYGKAYAFGYWINGLVFDAIHGIGNLIIASLLYKPVFYLWEKRLKHYIINEKSVSPNYQKQTNQSEYNVDWKTKMFD